LLSCLNYITSPVQVNETIMRSIVTQPPEHNYVYAVNFSSLDLVKNTLVNRTCTVPTTTTTPVSTYPPAPVNGWFCLLHCKYMYTRETTYSTHRANIDD